MTTPPWDIPEGAVRRGRLPPAGRQIWHEDDRGRRHGTAVRWYPSGQVRTLVDYRDGQRHGRYRAWHPGGTLAVTGGYEGDREHGLWQSFDEGGALQMSLPCVRGSTEGTCRSHYPNGAVAREWVARGGAEEGPVVVYLADGQRFSEADYVGGRRHGTRRVWLAGVKVIEDTWADGAADGPVRVWGWSGQLLQEGQNAGGQRSGWWRFWGFTGDLIAEGAYDSGVPVGGWAPPPPVMPMPAAPAVPASQDLAQGGPVATTVVTGFLGAGKTTVIRDLLRQKPPGERWVVYVNEFGEVGVDAAAMPAGEGLMVRELAGGCACCTSNQPFVDGIADALDTLRPDHLIVEPTGLADAGALIAQLRARLAGRLELRATLCVVDPRRLDEPRYVENPAYSAQLGVSDVVIANRCDLASPEAMARFRDLVARRPDLAGVLETEMGRVDLAWTTLAPADHTAPHSHHHDHAAGISARGFRFPGVTFSRARLEAALAAALPPGWMRLKGVIVAADGRWLLNADERSGGVVFDWQPTAEPGASRLECISAGAVDWAALEGAVRAAQTSS